MEKQNVPILRFPEFEKKLIKSSLTKSKILVIDGDRGVNYPSSSDFLKNGFCVFLSAKNVTKTGFQFDEVSFISSEKDNQLRKGKLERFDLVLTTRGSIGHLASYDESINFDHMRINSGMVLLRSKNSNIDSTYLYFLIKAPSVTKQIKTISFGSAQPQLTVKGINKIRLIYSPILNEQQKIASFLSAVDTKIEQLTRKKELLEQYKKGVMQKLFPKPGAQHPELRFKDESGEDFPDWEVKRFENIFDFISTNSLSRNDLTYESREIKNIHYGDIHTEFSMNFKVEEENVPYIENLAKLGNVKPEQFLKSGDLVIADASEDYADIGKAIEIISTKDEKILAGLHTLHVRDKVGMTKSGFKGYLFSSPNLRKTIKRISQGASVLGLSKKYLSKVDLLIPSSKEQIKIIQFLQGIDIRIKTIEVLILKIKTFKKGLLQQMFV